MAANCESVTGLTGVELPRFLSRFQMSQLRARNEWAITRGRRHVDPSRSALWNNLDCDILRYHTSLVADQMYVPAAYVGEALACCVGLGCAGRVGGLVNCERSRYHGDQAGTWMRVPPGVSPDWERVLGDIEVRISLGLQLEVPVVERTINERIDFIARQVEQAIQEGSGLHSVGRVARV